MKEKYIVKNREELEKIIKKTRTKENEDLNYVDVKDTNSIFPNSKFNGDISEWNVS